MVTETDSNNRSKYYKLAQVGGIKHEVRWWFVIKGDESVLEQLDEKWQQPPATIVPPRWKLEPLMRYKSVDAPPADQMSCNIELPSENICESDSNDKSMHSPSNTSPQNFLQLSPTNSAEAT